MPVHVCARVCMCVFVCVRAYALSVHLALFTLMENLMTVRSHLALALSHEQLADCMCML